MRVAKTILALSLMLSPLGALAQDQVAAPPVMRITVEEIKPGAMGSHEKQVLSYLALFAKAQVPFSRLGMVPVTGDQNRVVYLEGFPSFAELEASDKKLESTFAAAPALQAELNALDSAGGTFHASQRAMIAVFRADLSYRPLSVDKLAKSRYLSVTTSRIKPGHQPDYEAYVKQLNRARDKAGLDESTAVFVVTTGAPLGTVMTFTASRSLAEWDAFHSGMTARNKALDEALGGEEVVKQRREMAEAIFAESSSALFAFNPRISVPTAQIAAADPDFWTPKVSGKALAMKKEAPAKK